MIKLKNVSKFYYNKGIITSGFSRVNLELSIGEFVVITGESGSGKSTLLNVISGLDTYEEGEMYINGMETSHYTEKDFERYRKRYIGNIFQNFNLINSYTVFENIEMILLINGYSHTDAAAATEDIIRKVHLENWKDTKVSKLSGGQKQRVAIARALAKETDIIVADEPTGNLDSKSAKEVVRILKEISKDKLVIIVTHNSDQFENYATRRIRMNDGRISEDIVIETPTAIESSNFSEKMFQDDGNLTQKEDEAENQKSISNREKVRIGFRNTVNIPGKFILLMMVFIFLIFSVAGEYASLIRSGDTVKSQGYNQFFSNYDTKRIVVRKSDRSEFTEEDINRLQSIRFVDKTYDDPYIDNRYSTNMDFFSCEGSVKPIKEFENTYDIPDYGTIPEKDNEVIILMNPESYYISSVYDATNEILGQKIDLSAYQYSSNGEMYGDSEISDMTVSGIAFDESVQRWEIVVYAREKVCSYISDMMKSAYSVFSTEIKGRSIENLIQQGYSLEVSDKVKKGEIYVTENIALDLSAEELKNSTVKLNMNNSYTDLTLELDVADVINVDNIETLLNGVSYDNVSHSLWISPEDMHSLAGGIYQYSVFADNINNVDKVVESIKSAGFIPVAIKDTLSENSAGILVYDIIQVPVIMFMILCIFFICFFVIRLILKSRIEYFGTLRILGMEQKDAKRILDIELLTDGNIAFLLFLIVYAVVRNGIIEIGILKDMFMYLGPIEIIILYIVVMIMIYIISSRFSRRMFKDSAMATMREEV